MKKGLSVLLVLAMVLSILTFVPFTAKAAAEGTCGDNATWTLSDDGVLTISGTGAVDYPGSSLSEWNKISSSVKTAVIKEGITSLRFTLYRCYNLISVEIPDTVTTIGEYTFYECNKLTDISIPDSVTSIGNYAFYNCTAMTGLSIPDSVVTINDYAFYNCNSMTRLLLPDSVTTIGNVAFKNCSGLTKVTIPDSVTSIGFSAFYGCRGISEISIPRSVTIIASETFCYCTGLKNITIPDSVTIIGMSAFAGCGMTSIKIPNSVTSIANKTFSGSLLTHITIPGSVTIIGDDVFSGCRNLTSVTIPDSVTSIGKKAFYECRNLTSITIPKSVTQIGENAFGCCMNLERINVESGSANYVSKKGVLFTKDMKSLVKYPTPKSNSSYTIPDTVTMIDQYAFSYCSRLTSVTIPDSVLYIGNAAFVYSGLKTVVMPISIKYILSDAFFGCSSLSDVYYSGSLEDRSKITMLDEKVTLLHATWHYNSTGPDDPDVYETDTQIGFNTLLDSSSVCNCYVGEETKVTVFLKSDKFDIASLSFCVADKSIATLKKVSIGEGANSTSGTEKKAALYLDPKKTGTTTLTATAPNGVKATCTIIVAAKQNSEQADAIANQISNVNMGPFAIKGATITVAGYEIPLITLESTIKMDLGNLIIISNGEEQTIQVLLGFDQEASANIDGERNSTAYWSESYKEVKSMYQSLTGKKVSTTRLWNKYSSLRGKLKKNNANMVINVSSDLTGYVEFKKTGDSYVFSEGGVMASFSANTSLRSYYGPAYVALGLGVDANGSLAFKYENNKVNPQITVNPSFTVSAGGGIGTRTTYAEIDAYGTLGAEISSAANDPFKAYLDLGVKWSGYIIGKEIFSGSKSFVKTQLYPDFGKNMRLNATASTGADFSDMDYYSDMLNSSHTISREYLKQSKMSNRKSIAATGSSPESGSVDFERTNTYPLSEPSLVGFDDGTAMLVWIDDSGEKSDNNMCSLYYSFFSGTAWTEPAVLYENGTANDMPSVYSDGTYAYIVWQRADQVFPDNISVADMMMHFDLYESTFDSEDQSFTEPVLINSDPNTAFEFNPQICGSKGSFTVSWIENSDNNIMQLSGKNTLKTAGFTAAGEMTVSHDIASTDCIVSKTVLTSDGIYYCIQTDEGARLYSCFDNTIAEIGEVQDFAVANGKLFCLKDGAVCIGSDEQEYEYANLTGLNNFSITGDGESMYLFTLVLNEDFTKSLYYSVYDQDSGSWSALECYHKGGAYIRNYSPAIIGGKIFAAYNLVNDHSGTGSQQASLIVDGKTSDIDIQLNYIDFSDESIDDDNVILNFEVKNNSSQVITGIRYFVVDENDAIIDSGATRCDLGAFGTATGSIVTDKLDDQGGKQFSVKILPDEYTDYDLSNNIVSSTFEAIPDYQEVYILGDADGDGLITILDATVIQRYLASYTVLTPEYVVKCGDVNGEGVDILDATNIQRYLASFTVPYEIGKPIT